jgi:hypothetical protein
MDLRDHKGFHDDPTSEDQLTHARRAWGVFIVYGSAQFRLMAIIMADCILALPGRSKRYLPTSPRSFITQTRLGYGCAKLAKHRSQPKPPDGAFYLAELATDRP